MASTVSTPDRADARLTGQVVLCRVAGRVVAVELGMVREIIPARRPTRLPGAGPFVSGLVNVRGTIVTVLDLPVRFGRTEASQGAGAGAGSIVLMDHGAKVVGVAVDEVLDVRREAELELETEAEALVPGGAVRAVGRLDGEVVALLDIHDIIAQVLA